MMLTKRIGILLVATAVAGTASESAMAQPYYGGGYGYRFDNIRTFRNGDTEVTVSSACIATYNARGYRINNGRCSGDDITRADQQYADYRAQMGNNLPFGGNRGYGPPPRNIRTFDNGYTQVTVSSACIATYNDRGYRIDNGRCSGGDITRADQQYADYRAQFGYDRPYGGNRGYGPYPGNIRTFRNGDTEVTVSSACIATYNARGYRINNGRCSGDDITRADQQYAGYRAQLDNDRRYGGR